MTAPYVPSFLVPSAPASLSNRLGSNLTSDILRFQVRSQSPQGVQDRPAAFRYKTYRTPFGSSTRVLASDSFWLGTGNTQPYPPTPGFPASLYPIRPNCSFVYNGRLYIFGEDPAVLPAVSYNFSAPINGRNFGTLRQELSLPASFGGGAVVHGVVKSACVINGFAYVGTTAVDINGFILIYYAQINSDGSFSAWNSFTIQGYVGVSLLGGYTDTTGSYLIFRSVSGNWSGSLLNSDGAPVAMGTQVYGDALSRLHFGAVVVPSGANDGKATVIFIGGDDSATACSAEVRRISITAGIAQSSVTNTTHPLPAVRSWFGLAVCNRFIYVIGGTATAANQDPLYSGAASTIYYQDINVVLADSANWLTATNVVGAFVGMAAGGDSVLGPQVNNNATTGLPAIVAGFGYNSAGAFQTAMSSATCNASTGATNVFASGGANLLASGDLISGSVVNNQDGSINISWAMGSNAYQPAGAASFKAGDTVQVDVFILDQQGDVAPTATILFKMGSAPLINTISPTAGATVTDAVIPISWLHNPLTGDNPQSGWKVQISNYHDIVLSHSPVAYWPMGDQAPSGISDVVDVIAARNGVSSLPGTQTNQDGKIGAAMGLDGVGGTFNVASAVALHPGDVFSLVIWFRTSSATVQVFIASGILNDYVFYMSATGKILIGTYGAATIGTTLQSYNDGLWHRACWSKNGATNKLYVDGQDVTPPITNVTVVAGVGTVQIGSAGGGGFFNGSLQHAAIFNTALSQAQDLQEYNAAPPLYDSGFQAGQANSVNAFTTPGLPNGNYHIYIYSYGADIPYPGSSTGSATSSTAVILNAAAAAGGSSVVVGASP